MKVLLVNSPFRGGGITTYANELIKCLSKDHDLTVVLPDDSLRPITIPGVSVLHYDTQELSRENALFFIKLINEDLKPELVISSFGLITSIIVPYLDDNIRVITVSHSGKFVSSENSALNHKYVDNIIAASSEYNKNYLERVFHIKDKSKIKVIYNFMASNPELEDCRFVKRNNETVKIIYSGGWFPGKNPDLVLKVLYELLKTDLDFKFYWTGETKLPLIRKWLYKIVKVNDVRQFVKKDDRVVFTGRIPSKTEFDRLMASSNVLISPSRNEGSSMLVIEALRSGTICVVGDYPHGNREIIEKGKCGFVVDHRKPKEFASIITDIIRNNKNYRSYYDNAYDTYLSLLTYPVWKKSLDELILGRANHCQRRKSIRMGRISYDIFRMKMLFKMTSLRRLFQYTLKSLNGFYTQFIKMKVKGEFPSDNHNMMVGNPAIQ